MFLKTRYVSSVDKRCLGLIAGRNPLIYVCVCVCVCGNYEYSFCLSQTAGCHFHFLFAVDFSNVILLTVNMVWYVSVEHTDET